MEPVGEEALADIVGHAQEPFADSLYARGLQPIRADETPSQSRVVGATGETRCWPATPLTVRAAPAPWFRVLPGPVRKGLVPSVVAVRARVGKKVRLFTGPQSIRVRRQSGKWRDHASWRIICTDNVKKQIYSPELWKASQEFDRWDDTRRR